jgi:hypothetical protein
VVIYRNRAAMGFLPIFYAAGFIFIAIFGYVCLSVAADLKTLGRKVFVAILAFGASSYIGFIVVVLAIESSPLKSLLGGQSRVAIYALAYVGPGLTGSCLSLWVLRTLKLPKLQK